MNQTATEGKQDTRYELIEDMPVRMMGGRKEYFLRAGAVVTLIEVKLEGSRHVMWAADPDGDEIVIDLQQYDQNLREVSS